MLGYLEQSVATSIINALSAVGAQKPKYPFLSSTESALAYVAYHLKGEEIFGVCIWFKMVALGQCFDLQITLRNEKGKAKATPQL